MPHYCCVPFCKVRAGKDSDVSFHKFPKNDSLKQTWILRIRRHKEANGMDKPFNVNKHVRVCSQHFVPDDFKVTTQRKKLLNTAVPSVFPWNYCKDMTEHIRFNESIEDMFAAIYKYQGEIEDSIDSDCDIPEPMQFCESVMDTNDGDGLDWSMEISVIKQKPASTKNLHSLQVRNDEDLKPNITISPALYVRNNLFQQQPSVSGNEIYALQSTKKQRKARKQNIQPSTESITTNSKQGFLEQDNYNHKSQIWNLMPVKQRKIRKQNIKVPGETGYANSQTSNIIKNSVTIKPLQTTQIEISPQTVITKEIINNDKKKKRRRAKNRPTREMRPGCDNCVFKCHKKIDKAQRLGIFNNYWVLNNLDEQSRFVTSLVDARPVENGKGKRRTSKAYFLEWEDVLIRVCRVFFLDTLGINKGFVESCTNIFKESSS